MKTLLKVLWFAAMKTEVRGMPLPYVLGAILAVGFTLWICGWSERHPEIFCRYCRDGVPHIYHRNWLTRGR